MTDPRNIAQQNAAGEEKRIADIVDRRIRTFLKNGMPAGSYTSYLWDGMRIVGAGVGALAVDAVCGMNPTPSQTVLGDGTPYRVDFDDVIHDPLGQVTTGASWAFTAATAGIYLVFASAPLSIGGGIDWVDADRADLSVQGDVNETLCTWVGIGVSAQPANVLLNGFRGVSLAAGDVLYIRIIQDCGTDRDIDAAVANIIVGHV